MTKKVEINGNSKVRIKYRTKPQNATEELRQNVIALFAKKYGIEKRQIDVQFDYITSDKSDDICINADKIKDIQDPMFQQELIKKYMKINDINDCNVEEIINIDTYINSRVDFNKYEKKSTFDINWIKFSNFLSYGDNNYIDFRNFNGMVLLRGNPANQSGKTTLCNDLIHFLLFGKIKSGKADSLDQIFNKFRPECNTVSVEGSISVDNVEYIINRTLTRPEKGKKTKQIKNEVKFYRVIEDGFTEEIEDYTENLKMESTTKTNKSLKEAIGNEKDFDLMSCINAANLSEMIYMKDAEKSRSMIRWFGLQSIEDKFNAAKEYFNKEIMSKSISGTFNRETLKQEIDEEQNIISEKNTIISNNNIEINETQKKILEYQEVINSLHISLRKIDESLENVDYHTLIDSMEKIREEGDQINEYLKELEGKFSSMERIDFSEDELKSLREEEKTLIADIASIKYQIKSLQKEAKDLKDGEYCPVCKRKFENVDNSGLIAEKNKKIEELKAEGINKNSRKIEVEDRIKFLDNAREKNDERSRMELLISKKVVERDGLRNDYTGKLRLKKEIEFNKNAIEENNRIQNSLNIYKVNLKNSEDRKNYLINENTGYTAENAASEQKIRERQSIIAKIEKEQYVEKHWKTYLNAIGKDGITKMILKESIPQVNSQIKSLLDAAEVDFDVEIKMNDKNDIKFLLEKGNIEADLSSGSGYEQFVSAMAIRSVIGQFSAIPKPPFIIMDEIMGSVSSENLPRVRKLIEEIAQKYKFVFHVTHLDEVVDWHGKVITVTKKDNISSINIK